MRLMFYASCCVTQALRVSSELPALLAEIFSFPCYCSSHPGAVVTVLSLSYRLPALTHERLYCLSLHPLHLISGLQQQFPSFEPGQLNREPFVVSIISRCFSTQKLQVLAKLLSSCSSSPCLLLHCHVLYLLLVFINFFPLSLQ